uniref:Uncharacterized protein n=1 Tax=Aegilops tauschii subsp. strangulata TaxID=200361 RepID=A0A453S921_AEGTS
TKFSLSASWVLRAALRAARVSPRRRWPGLRRLTYCALPFNGAAGGRRGRRSPRASPPNGSRRKSGRPRQQMDQSSAARGPRPRQGQGLPFLASQGPVSRPEDWNQEPAPRKFFVLFFGTREM